MADEARYLLYLGFFDLKGVLEVNANSRMRQILMSKVACRGQNLAFGTRAFPKKSSNLPSGGWNSFENEALLQNYIIVFSTYRSLALDHAHHL